MPFGTGFGMGSASGGVSDGDKGDVVVSGGGTVFTVESVAGVKYTFVRKTTNTTGITSSSLATVTIGAAGGGNMALPVLTGHLYKFKASYLVQSDTTTSGISMSVTIPAVTEFAGLGRGISAADATSGEFQGAITASDDGVAVANVQAINTTYVQYIEGMILPSADGSITLRVANEAGAGNVSVRNGTILELWDFGT
jgi:hypothetical protein